MRDDRPGQWRIAFSDADIAARRWFAREADTAGLDVSTDEHANLHAVRPGTDPTAGVLGTGSHLDTVPGGGNLDGAAGVVVAFEVARLLADAGLRHAVGVTNFTGEEVGTFGISTIGSRGLAGTLPSRERELRDADGVTLTERLAAARDAVGAPVAVPEWRAFVEVHIEQGHRLDTAALPLSAVAGITAIHRTRLSVLGAANHAGTTVRHRRRDAVLATAAVLSAVEQVWVTLDPDGEAAVTIGKLDVTPNATNVIPARVDAVLELRSPDAALVDALRNDIDRTIDPVAAERGVALRREPIVDQPPRTFDAGLLAVLEDAVRTAGDPACPTLWSLAGHDAGHLAARCPTGMVFVRTRGGVSHAPAEDCAPEDLARAADAVAAAFLALDADLPPGDGTA